MQSKAAENSFNAVRLLAALQVAYMHATAHLKLNPLWGHEWIAQFPGVPIFFAVSGYLVFDSLLRLPTKRDFFRHRALRIYPALFVNILILEICFAAGGGMHVDIVGPIKALFFEFLYLITASDELAARWAGARGLRTFDGFFQIYPSGVLWTLTVELTFYAIVPLFAFARDRKASATAMIVALCALSIASNGLIPKSVLFSLSVGPYFWMFGIGMLFRLWRPKSIQWPPAIPLLVLLTSLFCAQARGLAYPEWKIEPSWITLLQTALLCSAVILIGVGPFLRSRLLAANDISYGVYLYHMLFVAVVMAVPRSEPFTLLGILLCSMAAGLMSWRLVERPAMKRKRSEAMPQPDALKSLA